MPNFLSLSLSLLLLISCSVKPQYEDTEAIEHTIWSELLSKYVRTNGLVDYEGFKKDQNRLQEYLDLLSQNPPNPDRWSREERLAYWINTYNAFTVKLIVDNYPVESIKDIKRVIPFVNSVWDVKFIKIGEETYDLNNIEHGILRKYFDEPRIHFAINCASISCPNLRNEAFVADHLEEQLKDSSDLFLSDKSKNIITENKVAVSKIFRWFKGDFTKEGGLKDFLRKHSGVEVADDAKIEFLDYDWGINSVAGG
jgi:hypothetical protein